MVKISPSNGPGNQRCERVLTFSFKTLWWMQQAQMTWLDTCLTTIPACQSILSQPSKMATLPTISWRHFTNRELATRSLMEHCWAKTSLNRSLTLVICQDGSTPRMDLLLQPTIKLLLAQSQCQVQLDLTRLTWVLVLSLENHTKSYRLKTWSRFWLKTWQTHLLWLCLSSRNLRKFLGSNSMLLRWWFSQRLVWCRPCCTSGIAKCIQSPDTRPSLHYTLRMLHACSLQTSVTNQRLINS